MSNITKVERIAAVLSEQATALDNLSKHVDDDVAAIKLARHANTLRLFVRGLGGYTKQLLQAADVQRKAGSKWRKWLG